MLVIAHRDLSKILCLAQNIYFFTRRAIQRRAGLRSEDFRLARHLSFFLSPLDLRSSRTRTLEPLEHRRLLSFSGEAVCFDEEVADFFRVLVADFDGCEADAIFV